MLIKNLSIQLPKQLYIFHNKLVLIRHVRIYNYSLTTYQLLLLKYILH